MAIRQYIGARYTPRFMGTYDTTQVYEALDVVENGLGTSYISKIPTPAGTPLTDTTYWQIYGASSGAIINLQNRMSAAESEIVDINKKIAKNIIIISDSYGVEGSPFVEHSFFYYLQNMLANSNTDVTLHTIAARGAAFGGQHLDPLYMYLTELETISANISDKNAITDIMIVGGYNDILTYPMNGLVTDSETVTGIVDFKNYANTNYPNAKLHFVPIGSSSHLGTGAFYANYNIKFSWLIEKCKQNGFAVNEIAPYVIATKYYHDSDNIHPSLKGQEAIAEFLFNYITCGYSHINRRRYFAENDVTPETGITISSLICNIQQIDGVKHLALSRINFSCPETSVSLSSWLPLCTLPADCIIDDMTRTQINVKPSNITYGPILRINNGVLELGSITAMSTSGLDLRGNEITCDALEA